MNNKMRSLLTAAGMGMVFAAAALAQDAGGPGTATEHSMSIREIIQTGGWLMYVLGAMSVIGLAMVIYFLAVLRQDQVIPAKFLHAIREMLQSGRIAEAQTACRSNSSAIAAILTTALDYSLRVEKPDPSLLREIIEGEGGRQATLIQNQTQYLLDIAVIAPMIGLLGTVMGMLRAFNTVALDLAKAKPMLLAGGVSQALVTTVAGLLVAIPAMIAYAYFRGRTSKLIANLETTSADLVTLIVKEKPR